MQKKKVIVILGATSTGKSTLAVELALKLDGEVISADSRQVYTGLDIGTGKITKKEMLGVPHHLLDIINPKKRFTVIDWKNKAEKKIKEILSRGKTPIICGGTAFYIDALVNNNAFPEVEPNMKLREKLNKNTPEKNYQILLNLDKNRASTIDKKNNVRLVRAIEIAKALGKVPHLATRSPSEYKFIKIGLTLPDDELKEKISTRLFERIRGGMIKEAKTLHAKGLSWKRMQELGLEYRYMSLYITKKLTKEEMLEKLNTEIVKFSKRQKTWWKKDKDIVWFNPKENQKILKLIKGRF